jgi:hypothetical protein
MTVKLRLRKHKFGLNCILLARWDEDEQEPWLIVTDLLPQEGLIIL